VNELNRFFRDAGVLLAFCGAFYFLTVLVGRLDGDPTSDESDFSPARKRADVMVQRKDWKAASIEFKTLTEQDPFDGHAWYQYGSSFIHVRRAAMQQLVYLQQNEENENAIAQLKEEIRINGDKAYEILLKTKEFARYRENSLLRLAVIETYRENNDQAMDFLEEYVDDGNTTQYGLGRYREFGVGGPSMTSPGASVVAGTRLHREDRFWDLVQKERVIRLDFVRLDHEWLH
jgi:tetratricopeptide (TPR) repeat protein